MQGRLDEAGEFVDDARQLQPQGIDAFRTGVVHAQLSWRRGDLERSRSLLERAEAISSRIIDPHLLGPLYVGLVETAVALGDDAAARRWSEDGMSKLEAIRHPTHHAPVLAAAATAAVRSVPARPEHARALLDRARALLASASMPGTPAELDVRTAEAELTDDPAAWQEVATAWEGLGDPFRSAYARLRLAEVLLAAGGDRDEAAGHLRVALDTARRMGADGLVSRAEDLGRRARLKVQAPPENPYRLTSREAEVLRLVAEGLTDREIGTRLFISHRTVERHVSNLLSKLGAARRAELVATALREGLLDADSSAG